MTVALEIVKALKKLGGKAHLNELYGLIPEYNNPSIRARLQVHCRESAHFDGKELFYSVYGLKAKKGVWALVDPNIDINSIKEDNEVDPYAWLEKNKPKPNFVNIGGTRKKSEETIEEDKEGEITERKVLSRKRNRKVVLQCKERDNYTCQACNFHFYNRIIQAHHLTPLSESGDTIVDINNLVSLCPNCHAIAHYLIKADKKYINKNNLIEELQKKPKPAPHRQS